MSEKKECTQTIAIEGKKCFNDVSISFKTISRNLDLKRIPFSNFMFLIHVNMDVLYDHKASANANMIDLLALQPNLSELVFHCSFNVSFLLIFHMISTAFITDLGIR